MDGKIFIVERSIEQLRQMLDAGPENVKSASPFITDLFFGKEGEVQVSDLSGEELQAAGFIGFTPHANCRCKLKKV